MQTIGSTPFGVVIIFASLLILLIYLLLDLFNSTRIKWVNRLSETKPSIKK